jgi:hypothetical protein
MATMTLNLMTPEEVCAEYKAIRHAVTLQGANVRAIRLNLLDMLKLAETQENRLRDMTKRLDAVRALLPTELRDE